ncbi:hypothetical protein CHS0354_020686 [Potamilus streckersoni]|uniref:Uncharacterized protein n=1 Tax=Potamilus streckersoni TaxID=2493646 RepID=A0AAE0TG23_9BIVA|nr:hypothetical protein CHS0354_020686 [Potamilus streckersoni]
MFQAEAHLLQVRGSCSSGNLSRSTYLWCIVPLSLASFVRGDYRATLDKDTGNTNVLRCGFYRTNAGQFWEQIGHYVASKMETFRQFLMTSPDPGAIFQQQVCRLSKDQPPHTFTQIPISMPMPPYHPLTYGHQSYTGGSYDDHKESKYEPRKGPIASGHANKTATITSTSVPYMHYEISPSTSGAEYAEKQQDKHEPWLSKTISSPNNSLSSIESDRRTPPFTHEFGRDSGNETLSSESSPEAEDYYRSLPSCRMQVNKNCRASPPLSVGTLRNENDLNFDAIQDQDKIFGNPQEFSFLNYLYSNAEYQDVSNISNAYGFQGNNINLPEVYPQYELAQETLSVYTAVENPFT